MQVDLDPVERITAGAIGQPGQRTFFLQARKENVLVSMLLEKGQVALLANHIDELLDRLGTDEANAPDPSSLDLEEPVVAEFRIGRIGLGFDEERDLVLLQCEEFLPEEDDEDDIESPEDSGRVRVWATRGQMYALARRGESEVAGGRPLCSMCGQAMDPGGHFCPRSNGHREVTKLA
jgi:uncharacterized repeat protein (TIGR03847 family)